MIVENSSFSEDIFNISYEMVNMESSLEFYSNELHFISESNKPNIFIKIKNAILGFIRKVINFIKEKIFKKTEQVEKFVNSTEQKKNNEIKKEIMNSKTVVSKDEVNDNNDKAEDNDNEPETPTGPSYKVKSRQDTPRVKTKEKEEEEKRIHYTLSGRENTPQLKTKKRYGYDEPIGPKGVDIRKIHDVEVPTLNGQTVEVYAAGNVHRVIDAAYNVRDTLNSIRDFINNNFKSYFKMDREEIEKDYEKLINGNIYNRIIQYKYNPESIEWYFGHEEEYDNYITLAKDGVIDSLYNYGYYTSHGSKKCDYSNILQTLKEIDKKMLKAYNEVEQSVKSCSIPEDNTNYSLLVKIFNEMTNYITGCNNFMVNVYPKLILEIGKAVSSIAKIDSFIINKYGHTAIMRFK